MAELREYMRNLAKENEEMIERIRKAREESEVNAEKSEAYDIIAGN